MLAESQPPRGLLGSFPYRCVPTHQGKTTGPMGDRKVGLRSRSQSLRGPKILRARDAGECQFPEVSAKLVRCFSKTHTEPPRERLISRRPARPPFRKGIEERE